MTASINATLAQTRKSARVLTPGFLQIGRRLRWVQCGENRVMAPMLFNDENAPVYFVFPPANAGTYLNGQLHYEVGTSCSWNRYWRRPEGNSSGCPAWYSYSVQHQWDHGG